MDLYLADENNWRAITRRNEPFPGSPPPVPADRVTGNGPANQGSAAPATAGCWADNGDGTCRYTFANSLTGEPIPAD